MQDNQIDIQVTDFGFYLILILEILKHVSDNIHVHARCNIILVDVWFVGFFFFFGILESLTIKGLIYNY